MPSRPFPYRSTGTPSFDLTSMSPDLVKAEEIRQEAFTKSRELQIALNHARQKVESGASEVALDDLTNLVGEVAPSPSSRTPRQANLSHRVEGFCRFQAFEHFLSTGSLIAPSSCSYATDEEYLAGACMGLCQDLSRYGMGRATARDVESVAAARNLVQELLDYLLKFDFRNGPLRRKYDGTKYALKSLETILYELSITGATETGQEPLTKKQKIDNLPVEELENIRKNMESRDEMRERLIKRCRDGQKAAKQAIYALHRGDTQKADKLLTQCEEAIIQDLLPIVDEEPPLRSGSFSNVMEEWVEAKLFRVWLLGEDEKTQAAAPSGIILHMKDFKIPLEPEEYLGGLCDLTGEIGRFAVQRGTARDVDGVKQCLDASNSIQSAIQNLERFPGGVGKKMDQLRRTVEKMERMLYEMSLSEAAGGRKVDSEEVQMEVKDD